MVALYEYADEIAELMRDLETRDDIDEESFERRLADLQIDFDTKLLEIAKFIKNVSADVEALSAEIKRLTDRRAAANRKVESLKLYALVHMRRIGRESVSTAAVKVRVQPGAFHVEHNGKLDEQWFKVERTLRKAALMDALRNENEIEGAWLARGDPFLVVS